MKEPQSEPVMEKMSISSGTSCETMYVSITQMNASVKRRLVVRSVLKSIESIESVGT